MVKKIPLILWLAIGFFLVAYVWSAAPLNSGLKLSPRFDWPDETANYFWSVHYAQTGTLALPEPLNLVAGNQIHPRSFNVRPDGALVPGSFLGLILIYGSLAKIFTTTALVYFTPILGALAALAFYKIIELFFNKKIAVVSAILLLGHPAWWYYAGSSMLPNVAFIAFILFSLGFLLSAPSLKIYQLMLAGFFGGLAISSRPSEVIWLVVVYAAVLIYQRHKLDWKKTLLFLAVAAITLAPSLWQQQAVYGSYLTSGYNQLQSGITTTACQTCAVVQSIIQPFGFHPNLY